VVADPACLEQVSPDTLREAEVGNTIAVQVHRWGSGAYLEDVDQWRYSRIFRDVWLYRTPQSRIRDAYITTDLDAEYRDAVLTALLAIKSRTELP